MELVIFIVGVLVGIIIDTILNIRTLRKYKDKIETMEYQLEKIRERLL